ncbi:MAG: leucine-rich repeat protein [Kiritimatiellae bacterium]|nr:leucine-rich repeat protein [Kiritimatiellia bacterium]
MRSIGQYAFYNCSGLTSVTIPDSVTSIGSSAFSGCSGLTSVTMPDGVTSIGSYAFDGCSGLTSVTIPDSVTSIGSFAFSGCSGLTAVHITNLTKWCEISFYDNPLRYAHNLYLNGSLITDLTIPGGVTSIGSSAFSGCSGLTSVTIPDSVTSIGSSAFSGCDNLYETNSIPGVRLVDGWAVGNTGGLSGNLDLTGVRGIGSSAFSDCSGLTSVTIPGGVTSIGPSAFYGCSGLVSVTIPDCVTSIGDSAFSGCSGLTRVLIPDDYTGKTDMFPSTAAILRYKKLNHQSVTFDANGGMVPETDKCVAYDSQYGDLPVPIRMGYSFVGWTFNGKSVSSNTVVFALDDHTLVAQWRVNQYTVAFDGNGADGDGVVVARNYGTAIVPPVLKRTGYTFIGWSPEVDATVPASNVAYTAQWRINQYVVMFDANGGGLVETALPRIEVMQDYGSEILVPKVSREDHDFAGWSPEVAMTVPASNVTYTAHWTRWRTELSAVGGTLREIYPNDYAHLTDVILQDGIRNLPAGFFDGCNAIERITLPSTMESVGIDDLPLKIRAALTPDADGFTIFQGWLLDYRNKDAMSLTVPEGIVGIGHNALSGMYDLEAVTLPQSLKYITEGAFREDTYLDNLVIPDGVETIGPGAFEDCSWLQSLTLGKSVKSVGARAFAGCTQLSSAVFADGLSEVGTEAFSGCWRMQSVSLPLSTTNVASSAFNGCTSLTGVTTPAHRGKMSEWFSPVYSQILDVTVPVGEGEVRAEMFKGCSKLRSVAIPEGITNVAASAFESCTAIGELTLPESLVSVGDAAFRGCGSLAAIVLPEHVERIGVESFANCASLSALTLSHDLSAVPARAFSGCSSLDSCVVPAAVTNLGSRFVSSGTTSIYYLGNAPACASDVYGDANGNLTSYVVLGTKGWDGRPNSRDIPQSWNGRSITTWNANRFDVTFDAAEGKFPWEGAATYSCEQVTGTGYSMPPFDPVRTGHTFGGWWTSASGGTRVTSSTCVALTKAHTLFARWTVDFPVTVQFNAVGGTVSRPAEEYAAGAVYGILPVPVREHFDFAGWWTQAEGGDLVVASSEVPKANHELFAHWTPCRYTIRFHANNGTDDVEEQSFTYGDTVVLRNNTFSLDNSQFAGWALAPGGAAVYADGKTLSDVSAVQDGVIHLYAAWTGNTYVVRFDSHGGVGRMDGQTFVIGVAQTLAKCAYTRAGFTFAGWATSTTSAAIYRDCDSVLDLASTCDTAVTLYAVWVVTGGGGDGWTSCGVVFDAQGGKTEMSSRTITSGAALETQPTPTRTGYAFAGWWTAKSGGVEVAASTAVTEDATFYARWTAIKYTIKFYANGGTGTMKTLSATYDKSVTLTANAFKRTGYKFSGWAKSKSGSVAYKDKASVKNLTAVSGKTVALYAVWTANKYKIKFNKNGGTGSMKTLSATYDKYVKLTANAFKRTGYKFSGWAKTKKGKVAYKNKAKVKNLTATNGKTVTLYAVWNKAKASSVRPETTVSGAKPHSPSGGSKSSVSSVSSVLSVPSWAVGTFYGVDDDALSTITVSKSGKVSGKVLFSDGDRWTLVGKASGLCIAAVVTDASGVSTSIALDITRTSDGRIRVASTDGSISAEN